MEASLSVTRGLCKGSWKRAFTGLQWNSRCAADANISFSTAMEGSAFVKALALLVEVLLEGVVVFELLILAEASSFFLPFAQTLLRVWVPSSIMVPSMASRDASSYMVLYLKQSSPWVHNSISCPHFTNQLQ